MTRPDQSDDDTWWFELTQEERDSIDATARRSILGLDAYPYWDQPLCAEMLSWSHLDNEVTAAYGAWLERLKRRAEAHGREWTRAEFLRQSHGKPYVFGGQHRDSHHRLGAANRQRATTAAKATAAAARAVLEQRRDELSARDKLLLQARADDSNATLRQLAERLGMTKSSYSSGLRRALRTGKD